MTNNPDNKPKEEEWRKSVSKFVHATDEMGYLDEEELNSLVSNVIAEARRRALAEVKEMVEEERHNTKPEERSDGLDVVMLDADTILDRINKMV